MNGLINSVRFWSFVLLFINLTFSYLPTVRSLFIAFSWRALFRFSGNWKHSVIRLEIYPFFLRQRVCPFSSLHGRSRRDLPWFAKGSVSLCLGEVWLTSLFSSPWIVRSCLGINRGFLMLWILLHHAFFFIIMYSVRRQPRFRRHWHTSGRLQTGKKPV